MNESPARQTATRATNLSLDNTFLARAAALVEAGRTPDEAIELAYEAEQALITEMLGRRTERARLAMTAARQNLYGRWVRGEDAAELERVTFGLGEAGR